VFRVEAPVLSVHPRRGKSAHVRDLVSCIFG
jgi:hypothetical protein